MVWLTTSIVLIVLILVVTCFIIYLIKKQGQSKKELRNQGVTIRMLQVWLRRKNKEALFLEKYLEERGYHTIAIYGNNLYANFLMDELKESKIKVKYMIAGTWSVSTKGVPIVADAEEEVDATIITTNIKMQQFREKYRGDLLTIYDILYDKDSQEQSKV